jgi:hypothetical protein
LGVTFSGNLGDELVDSTVTSARAAAFLRFLSKRERWRPRM